MGSLYSGLQYIDRLARGQSLDDWLLKDSGSVYFQRAVQKIWSIEAADDGYPGGKYLSNFLAIYQAAYDFENPLQEARISFEEIEKKLPKRDPKNHPYWEEIFEEDLKTARKMMLEAFHQGHSSDPYHVLNNLGMIYYDPVTDSGENLYISDAGMRYAKEDFKAMQSALGKGAEWLPEVALIVGILTVLGGAFTHRAAPEPRPQLQAPGHVQRLEQKGAGGEKQSGLNWRK